MAKLITQTFVITVSRMTRDTDSVTAAVSEDFAATLEAVITELASGSLVEVTGADHD